MASLIKRPGVEIKRVRQIAEVLIRNGLGLIVEYAGLTRFITRQKRRELQQTPREPILPSRIRKTFEELGPTFIKLGQILSTRPDILPPEYIVEFTRLLDSAPPADASDIIRVIEHELGGPLDSFFASFEREPLGSASIGQVHRAALLDGTRVVVKVQRPGVDAIIDADLRLLATQAKYLEAHSKLMASYHIQELVEEFSQALRDELNYTLEGRNADRLRAVSSNEMVQIPKVYWSLSTNRMLTLEELQGIKLSEVDQLRQEGYDLPSIAHVITAIYLKHIFIDGVFHADPHPANILVTEHKVSLVDFGSVGYISPQLRNELSNLLIAIANQRADIITSIIIRMGATDSNTDRKKLEADIQRLIPRYYGKNIEGFPMTQFLNDMMGISFKHHVRLPSDFILLARALVVIEGVVINLDPTFNLPKHVEPFARQLIQTRLSLKNQLKEGLENWQEIQYLLDVLPHRTDSITDKLEKGNLALEFKVRELDKFTHKLEIIANRLSFSLIVVALIIGSALATLGENNLTVIIPFTKISVPLAQFGFISASIAGTLLLISIIRSRGI